MRKSYKKIAAVLAIMILALAMTSTSFAENVTKNLKAYYRNITVYRNGAKVNFSNEPFILDDGAGGTTYVPLRDVSAMLGKEVKWDGTNYRIDVNDGPADANTVMLQTKVVQQEITITNLQKEVADLKAQLESKKDTSSKGSISTLSDMQKYLRDEYADDSDVYFDIKLTGSKNNVTVELYIDDKADSNAFAKWKNTDKVDFAQDIVDDILDELKSDKISGFYKDDYAKKSKQNFSVSNRGKVSMGSSGGSSSGSLSSLEDYIYSRHNSIIEVRLSEKGNTITADIYVDSRWPSSDRSLIQDIVADILYDFPGSYIDGAIIDDYDNYPIRTFNEKY